MDFQLDVRRFSFSQVLAICLRGGSWLGSGLIRETSRICRPNPSRQQIATPSMTGMKTARRSPLSWIKAIRKPSRSETQPRQQFLTLNLTVLIFRSAMSGDRTT
jgi:hypothetical protein